MLSHFNKLEFWAQKPKENTPLGKNWYRWEEHIIFILKEIGRNSVDRTNLAMDRDKWHTLVNVSRNIKYP
jgi:hypothetical protein